MKKLVLAFGVLFAISFISCINSEKQGEKQDPINDSIQQPVDTAIQVTGVAIDGAMNSITLLVGEDTVYFSYPDLDIDHRASWDIDDSVTVRYYATQNGDSVTDVINQTDA